MPRVYLTDADREKARRENADSNIRIIVKIRLFDQKKTQKAIAEEVGISEMTMSRKLHNPETLTLKEFRGIIKSIGMTPDEIARCI